MRDKSPKPDDLTIQHYFDEIGFKDRVRGLRGVENAIVHAKSYARFHQLPPTGSVRVIGIDGDEVTVHWINDKEGEY
jgi:hypothetical protein